MHGVTPLIFVRASYSRHSFVKRDLCDATMLIVFKFQANALPLRKLKRHRDKTHAVDHLPGVLRAKAESFIDGNGIWRGMQGDLVEVRMMPATLVDRLLQQRPADTLALKRTIDEEHGDMTVIAHFDHADGITFDYREQHEVIVL